MDIRNFNLQRSQVRKKWEEWFEPFLSSTSSSIGTATIVGFGLLNYRWVFSAGRFLQSAVASGTSNPQLGGPVIRMFQLPPPGVPHAWNDASEPQQRKVELWARNCREFCRKWRLPRHFWVLLHAVNLRHGTDGFSSPPKEGVLRIFSPEKSDGFGRVWTREPLDYRSREPFLSIHTKICFHDYPNFLFAPLQFHVILKLKKYLERGNLPLCPL